MLALVGRAPAARGASQRIIEILRTSPDSTRAVVAERTGLSRATVSSIGSLRSTAGTAWPSLSMSRRTSRNSSRLPPK